MHTRRWINQGLPQTLQIAVFLLYFTVFNMVIGQSTYVGAALSSGNSSGATIENFARLLVAVGAGVAGYLISNERRIGYLVGVAVAALPLAAKLIICVRFHVSPLDFNLLNLIFEIALFALLVHPMSRNHVRLWFK